MRVAAIDVGSNSIHMVVAQIEADGRFHVLDRAKEMVRLGQRTLSTGRFSSEAIQSGVRTLATFKTLAERQGVTRFKVVATSAVREAKNGGDFVQRVRDEIGMRVKVIPGREEARLIYLGVRHAIFLRGEPALIIDAGGGSVELVLIERDNAVLLESLKLGVSRLSERFLSSERPGSKQLAELEAHIAEQLQPLLARVAKHKIRRVIGTSGTMLNIVAIAGHLRDELSDGRLNNFAVSAEDVARVKRMVCKADRDERLRIKGLDAKRVDYIVPGVCLADYVVQHSGAPEMVACTWALREGVLLDFIARHRRGIEEAERYHDPRRRSVARFLRHLGDSGPHGAHTAHLALQLFDQLQPHLQLAAEARDWLEYAALMHDIGHHIGHKDHPKHSYYLISHGELLGFRPDELQMIALAVRYHQKAEPKETDEAYAALGKQERRTVRGLSALLRVADALDRSHYGVVRDLAVARRDGSMTIQLFTADEDAQLETWEARRRSGLLEEFLERSIDFQVIAHREEPDAQRAASVSR